MSTGADGGPLADAVLATERAYVAAATGGPPVPSPRTGIERACLGAVASRYLAVGTPRTIGIVIGDSVEDAVASLTAHHTWFRLPRVRWTGPGAAEAALVTGDATSLAEVLAADIVCIHAPMPLAAAQLRRGTHVNALAPVVLDDELRKLATIVDRERGLPALAAGLVDGRQLDELTVFTVTAS